MKLLGVAFIFILFNFAVGQSTNSSDASKERVKRNSCMQNCNSYRCSCPPNPEPFCKMVKVHNKWVVDAANCVSYCVHQSAENSGGYCKDSTCYCQKREILKPSKSLCQWVKVNGKMVIDAAGCVSHCVHLSPENSGGYCNQESCFCQKREVVKPPISALCEWVKVNGQMVIDASNCVSHCVHMSSENSGGYCNQQTCFCQKREVLKPSKALCEWTKVNGKMVINAANCVSHCVHMSAENSGGFCKQETCFCQKREEKKPYCEPSACAVHCKHLSHENSGGYCQQNSCFCQKALKKPLCEVIKVNNKWITDASGCTNHCVHYYQGMKNYGYCQGNMCYCK